MAYPARDPISLSQPGMEGGIYCTRTYVFPYIFCSLSIALVDDVRLDVLVPAIYVYEWQMADTPIEPKPSRSKPK